MKIIHVLARLHFGGVESVVLNAIVGAGRIGLPWECGVLTYDCLGPREPRFREAGIPVTSLSRHGSSRLAQLGMFRRYFSQIGPDVVHIHTYGFHLVLAVAARLAGVPCVVVSVHGGQRWQGAVSLRDALASWIALPLVNRQIAVSRAVRQSLGRLDMPRLKTSVIYNGVPLATGREAATRSRRKFNGSLIVGTVMLLGPTKDYRTFLGAARRVLDAPLACEFWVVGDGPERAQAERYAQDLQLGPSVKFWGDRADAAQLLSAMDIFVLPSVSCEGCSLALLEAMREGIACIATDTATNPEVIEQGRNGTLYRLRDPEDLAQQILRLARNQGLRESMAAQAAGTARQKFHIGRTVEGWNRVYQTALTKRSDKVATPKQGKAWA